LLKISNFLCLAENKAGVGFLYLTVAHFTVTGENKAGVDLVLIQNVLLYYLNHVLMSRRGVLEEFLGGDVPLGPWNP